MSINGVLILDQLNLIFPLTQSKSLVESSIPLLYWIEDKKEKKTNFMLFTNFSRISGSNLGSPRV